MDSKRYKEFDSAAVVYIPLSALFACIAFLVK